MSQAVKEAIAQRRAALAQAQKAAADSPLPSPTKGTFEGADIVQRTEEDLLYRSTSTARLNLSSRLPALTSLPSALFSLLDGEAPTWYLESEPDESKRRPWYEREDLRVLSCANNDLTGTSDERMGEFRGLARLELQNNALTSIPRSTFQLVNLTTLNLSKNKFTSIPSSLLALDSLIELDVSHNAISQLWSDAEVDQARQDRREWDEENADEEGGVWAGLIARTGSPTKRERPGPPKTQRQRSQPMRSLRILNLANNRLDDAALHAARGTWTWPPTLTDLDVSDNRFRSSLPLCTFGRLKDLRRLSLGGNGFGDVVFSLDETRGDKPETTPFGGREKQTFFPALVALDLQRCEMDDLASLQGVFETGCEGNIEQRKLVRVNAMANAQGEAAEGNEDGSKVLSVVLEGNPLREEMYKKKRGGARPAKPDTTSSAEAAAPVTSAPLHQPTSVRAPTAASSTSAAISVAPAQASPRKEAWELEAEAGLSTEGGRRRARAEAARREREAAAGGAAPSTTSTATTTPLHNGNRSQGINRTGLSDWDGTPAPSPRRNQTNNARGEEREQTRNGVGASGSRTTGLGSTLANAKLTKRQSEALGRVPCKFFRSANGCSAGAACPFSHTLPGEGRNGGGPGGVNAAGENGGGGKAVCEFFLKGNCRFGHKCALAHVREGEPMSMDRHNKKMQAAAQRAGTAAAAGGLQSGGNASYQQQSSSSQHFAPYAMHNNSQQHQHQHPQPSSQHQQIPSLNNSTAPWPPRDDFAFGLPDDMQGPQTTQQQQQHRASLALPTSDVAQTLQSSQPYAISRPMPFSSGSFGARGTPLQSNGLGTSPFGTSPFGQTVFFSGSHDDRSATGLDAPSTVSGSFAARNKAHRGGVQSALHDDDDDDHNGEDFLPSSLSDLLTPAELERRRRTSFNAQGLAAGSFGASTALTQSMPAGYGLDEDEEVVGGGIWHVGGNARQRPAARMSVGGYEDEDEEGYGLASAGMGPTAAAARRRDLDCLSHHHSPGQSLPKGLAAAGLSRLRISSDGRGGATPSEPVQAASRIPSYSHSQAQVHASPHRRALSNAQATSSSSSFKAASLLTADLGPIAPSSLHPHLPGGVLAARSGTPSKGGSCASGSPLGVTPPPTQREAIAIGSILVSPPAGEDRGMEKGGMGGRGRTGAPSFRTASKEGLSVGGGGGSRGNAVGSPLALQPREIEDDAGEEGVFELD